MTQKWSLGHIELGFKVSQISRSPLMEIKLKQGSVSKNLLSLTVHSLEIGLYSLFTVSQDMEEVSNSYRIQDAGYRMQDTGYRIQDTGYRSQDTVTQ